MKEFSLSKKVILISGASCLIGTEISDALASAGAKIALLDKSPLKKLINIETKLKITINVSKSILHSKYAQKRIKWMS